MLESLQVIIIQYYTWGVSLLSTFYEKGTVIIITENPVPVRNATTDQPEMQPCK